MKFKKLSLYLFMLLTTVYSVFAFDIVPNILKDMLKSIFQNNLPAYGLKFILWIILYALLHWIIVKKTQIIEGRSGGIISLTLSLFTILVTPNKFIVSMAEVYSFLFKLVFLLAPAFGVLYLRKTEFVEELETDNPVWFGYIMALIYGLVGYMLNVLIESIKSTTHASYMLSIVQWGEFGVSILAIAALYYLIMHGILGMFGSGFTLGMGSSKNLIDNVTDTFNAGTVKPGLMKKTIRKVKSWWNDIKRHINKCVNKLNLLLNSNFKNNVVRFQEAKDIFYNKIKPRFDSVGLPDELKKFRDQIKIISEQFQNIDALIKTPDYDVNDAKKQIEELKESLIYVYDENTKNLDEILAGWKNKAEKNQPITKKSEENKAVQKQKVEEEIADDEKKIDDIVDEIDKNIEGGSLSDVENVVTNLEKILADVLKTLRNTKKNFFDLDENTRDYVVATIFLIDRIHSDLELNTTLSEDYKNNVLQYSKGYLSIQSFRSNAAKILNKLKNEIDKKINEKISEKL